MKNIKLYDVIIIGGGPAGCAAAVYVARKKLKTLLITESFGGQSIVSDDIENWIGERHISGLELAKKFEKHVRVFPEVEIRMPEKATKIQPIQCSEEKVCDFEVTTDKGNKYQGKTLILAMGGRRKHLKVVGGNKFEGKGVAYCSTCDAPLFADKKVAIIGGGNAGLEAVVDLFPYATEIYLLEANSKLKGDPATQEKIRAEEKVHIIFNAAVTKIIGDTMVSGLVYKDKESKEQTLAVEGVFVEIGSVPNSEIVKDLVEFDEWEQIKIDSKYGTTSHPGIFAAGDVTDDPYEQNNISAGDGVKAALAAYAYLQKL